jgi:hypothetical protein
LAEPPLVEIPTATSSGLAWAMSWRVKIASVPMSLAMAVMLAGSEDRETAGTALQPGGGSTQSETRSFASVAEPPLPKAISFPPRFSRPAMDAAVSEMAVISDSATAVRRRFTSCIFWSIEPCTSRTTSSSDCCPLPRKGYRNEEFPTSWPCSRCSKYTWTVSQSTW